MIMRRLILISFVSLATSTSMAAAQTVNSGAAHHPRTAKLRLPARCTWPFARAAARMRTTAACAGGWRGVCMG